MLVWSATLLFQVCSPAEGEPFDKAVFHDQFEFL